MDRLLIRRLEAFSSSAYNEHYLTAYVHLASILELPSPDDDWQGRLYEAQRELSEAVNAAENPEDYYRAVIAHEASPLYTLPLLNGTIDSGVLKKNLRRVRKRFISTAVSISQYIDELTTAKGLAENANDSDVTIKAQVGVGSETAVLAALLNTATIRSGYVPVPAMPWHNQTKMDLLQHRPQGAGNKNTSYDIILLPLTADNLPYKIQVKTGDTSHYDYADDIVVVSGKEILKEIKPVLNTKIDPRIGTLHDMLAALPNAESRVKASRLAGESLMKYVFIDDGASGASTVA